MLRSIQIVAAVMVAGTALAQEGAKVEVKPITSTTVNSFGQEIAFPQGPGQVAVSMYEIPPGAELPVHKHPTPRIGYVLSGALQVTNVENGESRTFQPGEVILESVDRWHKGSNPSKDLLKLLVVDLQPKGAGDPTVVRH